MGNKRLVIFDLDKTITKIDTYIPFLCSILILRPYRILFTIPLPYYIIIFKLGIISETDLKLKFLSAIVKGIDKKILDTWVNKFIKIAHLYLFRRKALERIAYHKKQGDICILASASFDIYVTPIARKLQFDYEVSTKSCWSNSNELLPSINGFNLKGELKVNAIKAYINEKMDNYSIIVYTDHISDLPLLKYADEGYVINPNKRMKKIAKINDLYLKYW